jgi:hypothetical protein
MTNVEKSFADKGEPLNSGEWSGLAVAALLITPSGD